MNRVEDYYETACRFLELPDIARYLLGINFYAINFPAFCADEDGASRIIFQTAIRKGKWRDFKQLVINFSETRARAKKNVSYVH